MMPPDLTGRFILLTGATGGFGRALAVAIARAGGHGILMGRSQDKLGKLDDLVKETGGSATLIPADLSLPGTIEELTTALAGRFGRLDAVIGNAAFLGQLEPVATADAKTWRKSMAVNLIANQRLMAACDPLLRAAEAGRAVFITCGIAETHKPYWAPYATAKKALEHLALTYAGEVANGGVCVNVFDPGPMDTPLRREAFPGEPKGTQPHPSEPAAALLPMVGAGWTQSGRIERFQPEPVA